MASSDVPMSFDCIPGKRTNYPNVNINLTTHNAIIFDCAGSFQQELNIFLFQTNNQRQRHLHLISASANNNTVHLRR